VTLFLAVWGKPLGEGRTVGAGHLRRILRATRRQLIIRVGVQKEPVRERRLAEILEVCDEGGFDALGFSRPRDESEPLTRGNLILAHRRGTDARAGRLPPLALVPTRLLADHPVVQSASSIEGSGGEAPSPSRGLPKREARARERIEEIGRVADIRDRDRVLLLSARTSVQDLAPIRQRAVVEAGVLDADSEPSSYDVVLVLDSWGRPLAGGEPIGVEQLTRALRAARRQVLVRAGLQNDPLRERDLDLIFSACETEGFDVLAFSRGRRVGEQSIRDNLVVANRKGTDARTGELRSQAVIPSGRLKGHPIVLGAASVEGRR
jgi:hypothetical protein